MSEEIQYLKGVGPKKALQLNKLNIFTVEDLLEFFPRDYIERSVQRPIGTLNEGENVTVIGHIISIEKRVTNRGKTQLNVIVSDGSSNLLCVWFRFGQWITKDMVIGKTIWVSGRVDYFREMPQIVHPEYEIIDEEHDDDDFWKSRQVLPIYSLTADFKMKQMRKLIYTAFEKYHNNIDETLPQYILDKYGFPNRKIALQKVHFLTDVSQKWKSKARFILEEFLYTQLLWIRTKQDYYRSGINFKPTGVYTKKLYADLPFNLTEAQKRVIKEIFSDMSSKRQMNRLLQGDVGAGKTIVTLFAMLLAIENGYQAVLLAPTEILAEQHYKTISKLLSIFPEVKTALLKGGTYKGKKDTLKLIASGEAMIIVGTHALIQKSVDYYKVGLTVVDEQQRFGVQQRAELARKNGSPDMLYLSATPIPRSLALTVYGDLEISVLDELPPGRKPVRTIWKNESKKHLVYSEIERELVKGRQIYIVCPLIEETEKSDLLAAETLYEYLCNDVYPRYKISLLHGRMKNTEKDEIMNSFKDRAIDILVSTTVIEVGIDVPNASVMMIEHSERFGLSQLHQLRGRVGRGSDEAFCYLISYPPISKIGAERLRTMTETNDGFAIAEKDLELRGPGEFFGTKQSGVPAFKFANIIKDKDLLNEAKVLAKEILTNDPELSSTENRLLKEYYDRHYKHREKLFKY